MTLKRIAILVIALKKTTKMFCFVFYRQQFWERPFIVKRRFWRHRLFFIMKICSFYWTSYANFHQHRLLERTDIVVEGSRDGRSLNRRYLTPWAHTQLVHTSKYRPWYFATEIRTRTLGAVRSDLCTCALFYWLHMYSLLLMLIYKPYIVCNMIYSKSLTYWWSR